MKPIVLKVSNSTRALIALVFQMSLLFLNLADVFNPSSVLARKDPFYGIKDITAFYKKTGWKTVGLLESLETSPAKLQEISKEIGLDAVLYCSKQDNNCHIIGKKRCKATPLYCEGKIEPSISVTKVLLKYPIPNMILLALEHYCYRYGLPEQIHYFAEEPFEYSTNFGHLINTNAFNLGRMERCTFTQQPIATDG